MDEKKLEKILEDHILFLEGDNEGVCADLSGEDLNYDTLRAVDLSFSNLNKASIQRADLRDSSFHKACLYGADLTCTNLRGTDLSYADLGMANLSFANLKYADLENAKLAGANIRGIEGQRIFSSQVSLGDKTLIVSYWKDIETWVVEYFECTVEVNGEDFWNLDGFQCLTNDLDKEMDDLFLEDEESKIKCQELIDFAFSQFKNK